MQFYKKDQSGRNWQRKWWFSLFSFLRDTFVYILPIRHLPEIISKICYGINPKFVFFVHPRRLEDVYVALPFLGWIRRIFGKKIFLKTLRLVPPMVLSSIRTLQGVNGLIISSSLMPEFILGNRRLALKESIKGLHVSSKIAQKAAVFGLGGLWPMVTRRGLALRRYQKKNRIIITNGHCGTLISLVLMIKRLADLADLPLYKLKIAILGVGKMGTNLISILYGKVGTITLIDINEQRLNSVESKLREVIAPTDIQKYTNHEDVGGIKDVLAKNHIIVCTTSNLRRILKPDQIPDNTIIIDDSRPEAIPRELGEGQRVVIEGGLLKIRGIRQFYNFGLGVDENVFGCLAEAFLLAADSLENLQPTLGDINFSNFEKMLLACNKLGVDVGDFKCRDEIIPTEKIVSILKSKIDLMATIPFKNICWLLKVEDLIEL
jgi:predicted amino acid dehydrogenase